MLKIIKPSEIDSVIGTQYEPSTGEVSAAIDSLSKGEIGAFSAAEASSNPAPHKYATQVLETVLLEPKESPEQRKQIDNIPLPCFIAVLTDSPILNRSGASTQTRSTTISISCVL